jgi:hypothetical protein
VVVERREDVIEAAIVAVGPEMSAGAAVDQLDGDAQAIAGLAHAAFEDMADVQFARRGADFDHPALVGEDGIAGDDEERGHPRQVRDDVFGQAVGEIFLLGIAADVGERQHGDGRPTVGRSSGRRRAGPLGRGGRDARLDMRHQGAKIRIVAQRIEGAVLPHPFEEGMPVDGE